MSRTSPDLPRPPRPAISMLSSWPRARHRVLRRVKGIKCCKPQKINHNIEIEGQGVKNGKDKQGRRSEGACSRQCVASRTLNGNTSLRTLNSNMELAEFRPSTVTPSPVSSHPTKNTSCCETCSHKQGLPLRHEAQTTHPHGKVCLRLKESHGKVRLRLKESLALRARGPTREHSGKRAGKRPPLRL